ncbi:MAG: radical SAM protein [Candidatus Aenigmarchaeota archaeon]|nr:radical SAM protein [Candidatus Aenigmarchaeota archaeon]
MNCRDFRKPEQGPIRTPSESESLSIRVNRNCPWNRCLFCPVYKGKKFNQRSMEEIKKDIDYWVVEGEISLIKSIFLQDSDVLQTETGNLIEILEYINQNLPSVERITCYTRASTITQKTPSELVSLHRAGLSALYIGLESGYDKLLSYMRKGLSQEIAIETGLKVKESGMELNFFILLGLAGKLVFEGKEGWKMHALETAKVLNKVDPDFIRFRTLYIYDKVPLSKFVEKGVFEEASGQEVLQEQTLLIENLNITSKVECFFISNYFNFSPDAHFPEDKEDVLKQIKRALEIPQLLERRSHLRHL